jgi:hypothetical protein
MCVPGCGDSQPHGTACNDLPFVVSSRIVRPGDRTNRASLVNAAWIVLALAVAVAVLMLSTSWRRRDQQVDLGSVSHQWIAEQRMGQAHDPQR